MRALLFLGPIARSARRHRWAFGLVVAQVAVAAAVTVHTLALGAWMRGFQPGRLGGAGEALIAVEVRQPAHAEGPAPDAAARLAVVRGVEGVRAAVEVSQPPFDWRGAFPDAMVAAPAHGGHAWIMTAGAGVVDAFGARLVAGRDFAPADLGATPTPVILSRAAAERIFPGLDAVGRELSTRARGRARVVGVVESLRLRPQAPWSPEATAIYAGEAPPGASWVVVRGEPGQTAELSRELEARLGAAWPGAAVTARPLSSWITRTSGALGIVAGYLVAVVLMVLVASAALAFYLVARRTREIGLRRALGARRRDILAHFLLEGVLATVAGLVFGAGVAAAFTPALQAVEPSYRVAPAAALATAGLFILISVAATWFPARSACRVPPTVASKGG